MKDYTSVQYLFVILIFVDQTLNASSSAWKHSAKKRKHNETSAYQGAISNVSHPNDTELYLEYNIHKPKRKYTPKYLELNVSQRQILRNILNKHYAQTKSDSKVTFSSKYHADIGHKNKQRSQKRNLRYNRARKTEHVTVMGHLLQSDVSQSGSREDIKYKRITELYAEEPISKNNRENAHHAVKNADSIKAKAKEIDTIKKKHKDSADGSFLSQEIFWESHIDSSEDSKSGEASINHPNIKKHDDKKKRNKLPFYVTSTMSTKKRTKTYYMKQNRPRVVEENETAPLLKEIITVFRENNDLKHKKIDLNATLSRLASSKIIDLITDRVANQMMKKIRNRLKKNALRTHDFGVTLQPNIEQIEIIFNSDDIDLGREHKTDKINYDVFE